MYLDLSYASRKVCLDSKSCTLIDTGQKAQYELHPITSTNNHCSNGTRINVGMGNDPVATTLSLQWSHSSDGRGWPIAHCMKLQKIHQFKLTNLKF
jgi:hypothetical protein